MINFKTISGYFSDFSEWINSFAPKYSEKDLNKLKELKETREYKKAEYFQEMVKKNLFVSKNKKIKMIIDDQDFSNIINFLICDKSFKDCTSINEDDYLMFELRKDYLNENNIQKLMNILNKAKNKLSITLTENDDLGLFIQNNKIFFIINQKSIANLISVYRQDNKEDNNPIIICGKIDHSVNDKFILGLDFMIQNSKDVNNLSTAKSLEISSIYNIDNKEDRKSFNPFCTVYFDQPKSLNTYKSSQALMIPINLNNQGGNNALVR
jgi:hypothetical protein